MGVDFPPSVFTRAEQRDREQHQRPIAKITGEKVIALISQSTEKLRIGPVAGVLAVAGTFQDYMKRS